MTSILVTGATGLLGSALVPLLCERGRTVARLGRSQATDINADLSSYEQTARVLERVNPDVIINLIALTDVDRCETHPQEAYSLNVKPIENLCNWMRLAGEHCHLIQISSDQLYDGLGPHSEDKVVIRNHYAMSKVAAEFAARNVNSTILRTNFIGRSLRDDRISLTDWLYDALSRGRSINVFDDVLFNPLSIGTLCDFIELCVVKRPLGVFNLGSHDGMSKADFAFAFAAAAGLPTANLSRRSHRDLGKLLAYRPTDMRMRCDRFEDRMKIRLPRLLDEIKIVAEDYR
jgi:dTDP-4-dehydrorhamnose reductase